MELIGIYTVHKTGGGEIENDYPVHSHISFEILFLVSGNCEMLIGDTRYKMNPGDTAFISENVPHGFFANDGPFDFYAVQFIPRVSPAIHIENDLSELNKICKEKGGSVFKFDDSITGVVECCLGRICRERRDTDVTLYFSYIKSVLYELLHHSAQKEGVTEARNENAKSNIELFNAISDYISANLNDISNMTFVENVFHYSKSHVNKVFNSVVGMSVWKYITVKRLDLAKNLLADGCSAKNAAIKSGFSDYSVFYKAFVKEFGAPPSGVKKRNS